MTHREDCHVPRVEKEIDPRALDRAQSVVLVITGMGCPNCANRVRNALLRHPGVLTAEVDLREGLAAVALEPGVDERELSMAVATADPSGRHPYRAVPIGAP